MTNRNRGRGSPRAITAVDAGSVRQQPHKFALDFENDFLGAALCHQRRIAHELDGVARTLLGVQQNGLAGERFLAEP